MRITNAGAGAGISGTITAPFNIAANSTDAVLVFGAAGKQIVVLQMAFVTGLTATNVTFNSFGTTSTPISCTFQNAGNGGGVLPYSSVGWFSTNAGESLTVTTGAGSTTGILLTYTLI